MDAADAPAWRNISFRPKASRAMNGIAAIFDLEGFSKFFNQPDVQEYVPSYLNHVFDAMSSIIGGGTLYWSANKEALPLQLPVHQKFLGDGMLYVWAPPDKERDFSTGFIVDLANRFWNLKTYFPEVIKRIRRDIPIADLPPKIRFGLARGTIYQLTNAADGSTEYIGICINLASRLQEYCAALGFIASARLGLPNEVIEQHGYMKVVAKAISGFRKEVVIVDRSEYEAIDPALRDELFSEV